MKSSARRWLLGLSIAGGALVAAFAGLGLALHQSLPEGTVGPEAVAIARAVERAVDAEAWARTGAVRWQMQGRRRHLWDRRRSFAQVAWGDVEVLLDLQSLDGVAVEAGVRVDGAAAAPLLERAYALWCNDSFWLNPAVKLFDDGAQLSLVDSDGHRDLLVTYGQGGVTPGDAYLWRVGPDGLPVSWRMWVSIIPIGGLEVSWHTWQTLSTGAKVSTRHDLGPIELQVVDVAGAETLAELLDGADPFEPLL